MNALPSPPSSAPSHDASSPTRSERQNFILIDFENVQVAELPLACPGSITFIIIVGEKQVNLPIGFTEFLQLHPGQLRLIKTPCQGRNALDFILAHQIGRIVSEKPKAYIHIISRDQGFDALILHLKWEKHLAARHESIAEVPALYSDKERHERLVEHLKDPNRSRPRKRTTLENTVKHHFGKSIEPAGVAKTIKRLIAEKVLTISEGDKITYPRAGR